jgi:phosphate transport system substrate-binding protein
VRKIISMLIIGVFAVSMLAGCGAKNSGGTVSTDGSTSMEKVIGALGESYMAENKNVTFTYNPTGSGSGIKAVLEGTLRHRTVQQRPEGRGKDRGPDGNRARL